MSMITGRYVHFEGNGMDGYDSIVLIQVFTADPKDGFYKVFALNDFGLVRSVRNKWDWHAMSEECTTPGEADAVFNNFRDEMILSGWDVRSSGLNRLGEY